MKVLLQPGFSLSACGHAQASGRVPVPPLKKRFLINLGEARALGEMRDARSAEPLIATLNDSR